MAPTATIIITAYNNETTIVRAIESAISQCNVSSEIIIIDDCSTDTTPKLLAQYSDITVIKNDKNIGPYLSRLIGINKATGEFLTFIDGDDWLNKDALSRCLTSADKHNADIVHMTIKRRFSRFDLPIKYSSKYDINSALDAALYNDILFPVGCCGKLYRTQLLKSIKFPPINLRWGEDRIFNLFAYTGSSKITLAPEAIYNYRWGGNGTRTTINTINDYTHTTLYKLDWATAANYSHLRKHILNEHIKLASYWVRQVLNSSNSSQDDIINALKSSFSIVGLDETLCKDIYAKNARSCRRYISNLVQIATKILS